MNWFVAIAAVLGLAAFVGSVSFNYGYEASQTARCHEKGGERVTLHGRYACVRIVEEIK